MHKHAQMHLCVSMHEKMKSAVYGVDGMQLLHDVPFWPSVFALLCSGGLENEQSPLPARASGPIHPFGSLSVCLSVSVSGGVPAGLHVSVHVCASACTCMDATGKPNTSKQCLRMQTTGHPYPVPWRLQKGLTAASAVALQDAGRRWSSGDDHWAHDSQRT